MSAAVSRLDGAHALRRTLDALAAPAASIASLCQAAATWDELCTSLPAELVRPPDAGDRLATAIDALETGDGAPAGTMRAARRSRAAADRLHARPTRPAKSSVRADAPERRRAPAVSAPRSIAPEDRRAGGDAMSAAWERAGLGAVAAALDPRADSLRSDRGGDSGRSLATAASKPRGLADLVGWWRDDDILSIAAAAVRAPIVARGTELAHRPASLDAIAPNAQRPASDAPSPQPQQPKRSDGSAPPPAAPASRRTRSRVATTPSFPNPAVAPSPVDGAEPALTGDAIPPRGLAGLASWWRERDSGAEPSAAPLSAPIAGDVTALAPRRAAVLDAVPTAPSSDRHALGALLNVDDVTRLLERLLVRELRRHGVTPEEP